MIFMGSPSSGAYLILLMTDSGLMNSHNPGAPVLVMGPNSVLLMSIATVMFPIPFDNTIAGPASASLELQLDSTQPPFPMGGFLGPVTTTFVSVANALGYTPGAPGNWVGPAPTFVQQALDRIAARVVTLGGGPIP